MTVYFAQGSDSGLVKIGFSRRTWNRLDQISASGSDKLHLLRVCEGGRVAEQWVHRKFSALRCHGEWFKFSQEMMTFKIPEEIKKDTDCGDEFDPVQYEINVEQSVRACMRESYAHLRGARKIVAEDANVLPRTAQNWLAEVNLPGAVPLIQMLAANKGFRESIYSLVDELSAHRAAAREELKK